MADVLAFPVYVVTFERVGRNRHVAPLTTTARSASELAAHVYRHARPHLGSNAVHVDVDLEEMRGFIVAGFRTAGSFTIEASAGTAPMFELATGPLPKSKPPQIMRTRQDQCMRHGAHPLTAALGRTIPLHPAAAPADDKEAPGLRCGSCVHRLQHRADTAGSFPKCHFGAGTSATRITHGPGTDVRAWWPACIDHKEV